VLYQILGVPGRNLGVSRLQLQKRVRKWNICKNCVSSYQFNQISPWFYAFILHLFDKNNCSELFL